MNFLSLVVFCCQVLTFGAASIGCFGYYIKATVVSEFFYLSITNSLWQGSVGNAKVKAVKAFIMIGFILAAIAGVFGIIILLSGCSFRDGPRKRSAKICGICDMLIGFSFTISSILWIVYVQSDAGDAPSFTELYSNPGFISSIIAATLSSISGCFVTCYARQAPPAPEPEPEFGRAVVTGKEADGRV